ncbi:copper resistance CopC family protein [Paenibacillus caui]|uniref:copper resistance CopC family protein n=1 Tax=Paenibacillus caui TaxID=2873927 RepID=UPI001CA8EFC4|nr:copper resistance CopC family protein [Paenibacillus caui]
MKRIWMIAIVLLWSLPGLASAHSHLEDSAPAKDGTVTESPAQIEMTFNTAIEKLSSFKLYNEAGEEIDIGDTSVNGAVLSGPVQETLPNGKYTVKWTIVGEDGHSVKGEYAFAVEAAAQASPSPPAASPEISPEASPQPADNSGEDGTAPADNGEADSASEPDGGPYMTAAIAIGVIIIVAAVILIARNRKR